MRPRGSIAACIIRSTSWVESWSASRPYGCSSSSAGPRVPPTTDGDEGRGHRKSGEVVLRGERRRIDVGRLNGERFAVMAGSGIDAAMIRDADGGLKARLGRIAYVWSGLKTLRSEPFGAEIKVDGIRWFKGDATCIL